MRRDTLPPMSEAQQHAAMLDLSDSLIELDASHERVFEAVCKMQDRKTRKACLREILSIAKSLDALREGFAAVEPEDWDL